MKLSVKVVKLLYWQLIAWRIQFKLLSRTYRVLRDLSPSLASSLEAPGPEGWASWATLRTPRASPLVPLRTLAPSRTFLPFSKFQLLAYNLHEDQPPLWGTFYVYPYSGIHDPSIITLVVTSPHSLPGILWVLQPQNYTLFLFLFFLPAVPENYYISTIVLLKQICQ